MKKIVLLGFIGCLILVGLLFQNTVTSSSESVSTRPIATVQLSNGATFKIELYPEEAPNTVNNFLYLSGVGFYNNTCINRIVPGYLVQAGDPIGNGKGFPGYFIKSECKYNGTQNSLKHKKGTVSMARSTRFNTEGSQFFVLLDDANQLNGQYSAFGRVIEGMDIVETLGNQSVDTKDRPKEDLRIKSITVNTFGIDYASPDMISVEEALAQDE